MLTTHRTIARHLAPLAVAGALVAGAAAPVAASTFQGCGWYVIMGCAKSYSGAQRMAGNGALVVNTSDYPNFRNGWYCAADGPFNRKYDANSLLFQIEGNVPDAYVKKGC